MKMKRERNETTKMIISNNNDRQRKWSSIDWSIWTKWFHFAGLLRTSKKSINPNRKKFFEDKNVFQRFSMLICFSIRSRIVVERKNISFSFILKNHCRTFFFDVWRHRWKFKFSISIDQSERTEVIKDTERDNDTKVPFSFESNWKSLWKIRCYFRFPYFLVMADHWDDEITGATAVRDDDAPDDWETALDEKVRWKLSFFFFLFYFLKKILAVSTSCSREIEKFE